MLQDLRFAIRSLRRAPGLAVATLLTLAVGIGANSAIFSVLNAVWLQPLAYGDPDRLVVIFGADANRGEFRNPTSPANYLDWQERSRAFERLVAAYAWSPVLTEEDAAEQVQGLRIAPGFTELLGVSPLLGRGFREEDGQSGAERVVLLSHGLWQRRFGEDPRVVGRSVRLDREAFTVVGVMPPGFEFPPFWVADAEVWAPLVLGPDARERRRQSFLRVFGRLRPGTGLADARAEMAQIAAAIKQEHPEIGSDMDVSVELLKEVVVGGARRPLLLLWGLVGLVLLVACANVANLMLARGTARFGELAVRTALGASQWRLARQLMTESLVLAAAGGLASLLLLVWLLELVRTLGAEALPRVERAGLDATVVLVTAGLSVATGLVIGSMPALRLTGRSALSMAGRGTVGSHQQARELLVAGQIAVALTVLAGAGLLVRDFVRVTGIDPGFRRTGLLVVPLSLAGSAAGEQSEQLSFFRQLLERVGGLPGVTEAAFVNHLPIGGDLWRTSFTLESRPSAYDPQAVASYRTITPEYFSVMGIPVRRGRPFAESDRFGAPGVVIVNETFAERFWPGEDPVGERIKQGGPDSDDAWLTVVGVVGDVREEHLTSGGRLQAYFPYAQNPVGWYTAANLIVRTATEPFSLAQPVRAEIRALDSTVSISAPQTVDGVLGDSLRQERFRTMLFGGLAGLTLILAVIGTYGIVAFSVSLRTREIGVRMALGASAVRVVWAFVRRGALVAACGIAVGLLGAYLAGRLVAGLLVTVSPTDPATLAAVSGLVLAAALLACYLPARRATRVDPVVVLRVE